MSTQVRERPIVTHGDREHREILLLKNGEVVERVHRQARACAFCHAAEFLRTRPDIDEVASITAQRLY